MPNEPIQTFPTIRDALGEATNLRSDLAIAIRAAVESWNLTQAQAATRLGVTQPRLNDLLKGRLNRFSLDALVALAERAHSPSAYISPQPPPEPFPHPHPA